MLVQFGICPDGDRSLRQRQRQRQRLRVACKGHGVAPVNVARKLVKHSDLGQSTPGALTPGIKFTRRSAAVHVTEPRHSVGSDDRRQDG